MDGHAKTQTTPTFSFRLICSSQKSMNLLRNGETWKNHSLRRRTYSTSKLDQISLNFKFNKLMKPHQRSSKRRIPNVHSPILLCHRDIEFVTCKPTSSTFDHWLSQSTGRAWASCHHASWDSKGIRRSKYRKILYQIHRRKFGFSLD